MSLDQSKFIEVIGARSHNLKNIDVQIPSKKLVVITGVSGSGKSSLAFDTIYAEGQRRYIDSFSSYAKSFLGNIERPDVDQVRGLSPVVSIEQKTVNKSPRSTVGTITEIYDYLRLLFARVGTAYSHLTGQKMVQYTSEQILDLILQQFSGKKAHILSPVVKGRKGHYKELFEKFRLDGFLKARVDKQFKELSFGFHVDRYKVHDIEIVIDKLVVDQKSKQRLSKSIELALKHGDGALILNLFDGQEDSPEDHFYSKSLMDPSSGISYDVPAPNSFSFNSPYGACTKCNGIGTLLELDEDKVFENKKLTIKKGGIAPLGAYKNNWVFNQIEILGKHFDFNLNTPIKDLSTKAIHAILNGANQQFSVESKTMGITYQQKVNFPGLAHVLGRELTEKSSKSMVRWAEAFMNRITCKHCGGARLKKESLHFKIGNHNIAHVVDLNFSELKDWVDELDQVLSEDEKVIASEIVREISARVQFILDVGLHYLTLNRSASTLSGGEAQRIRLATQIGAKLTNVLYILDEPSIGLHQRDNHKLIESLKELRDIGNSVLVVEHDKDIMLQSDYIIDIGPKAGKFGGDIIAQGAPNDFLAQQTTTADFLSGSKSIEIPSKIREGNGLTLQLLGCTGHNLKNVDLTIPLGKLICVTGVSGSGKSSLINGTLHPVLSSKIYKSLRKPLPYKSVKGIEHLDKVIVVDQSPIGRTPRSNPVTYTGVFTDIRALFASLPEAKIRGYNQGRFSFNVKGGRCETCKGGGLKVIEMNFLPDIYVECEDCQGKRYNKETLQIKYKGKSISDVLNMTIDQAVVFFETIHFIHHKLKTIQDVGLGYLTLGQSSVTLSGGEAQRVKLASELSKKGTGKTLYIMDEPSTGLHFDDIKVLLAVIQKLVDAGNTVLIIEHNLDIIKVADHIIDLGPDGGAYGGQILCQGTPQQVAEHKESFTAKYLKEALYE